MKNHKSLIYILLFTMMVVAALSVYAQQQSKQSGQAQSDKPAVSCPMMKNDKSNANGKDASDADRLAAVSSRGEEGMGFSQTATTHHFLLMNDGGAIQVEVNDPKDAANRDEIRMHLAHISRMFSDGDFNIPMFVHEQTPPGVPVMEKLKADISYKYEETERGGRVRIKTTNKEALAAVHEFLRFQIKEHQTGDPLELSSR
ncbi:MAG TPA: hypothetical protein VGC91_00370 [Pyrinomonadaceae bacterium]